jgi:tRNA A-37 threonylcarbamoyl transferase component Bud32
MHPHRPHEEFFHITSLVSFNDNKPAKSIVVTKLNPFQRLRLVYGVAVGMRYVHGQGILHRDMKLDNVFLDEAGPRIGDLGFSKALTGELETGSRGTDEFMAPEVLDPGKTRCPMRYGLPADVYSYGILLRDVLTGANWVREFKDMTKDMDRAEALQTIKDGNHPNLDQVRPPCAAAFLKRCFDLTPAARPTFADVVTELDEHGLDYFPGATQAEFDNYKADLESGTPPTVDEDLLLLVRQLRNMAAIDKDFGALPVASPFMERTLLCFGLMFDDAGSGKYDAAIVARYQFATRYCLERDEFLTELRGLQTFPGNRAHFPLAGFLVDVPATPSSKDGHVLRLIKTRDDLFRALREISAGICCQHPCVLRVLNWNIQSAAKPHEWRRVNPDANWAVYFQTEQADDFSEAVYAGWDENEQHNFLVSAARGLAWIHNCGIFHNNLSSVTSYRCRGSEAQICGFGLSSGDSGFCRDTVDFADLFRGWRGSKPVLERVVRSRDREDAGSTKNLSFEEYVEDQVDSLQRAQPERDSVDFPFDLFYHLVDTPDRHRSESLWSATPGPNEPLDAAAIAEALAQLTRGLNDDTKLGDFKRDVKHALETRGSLPASDFPRWPKSPPET